MKIRYFSLILLMTICCTSPDPNTATTGENELEALEIHRELDKDNLKLKDLIYVPIYSDIYADLQNQNLLLAATLSIRNTSLKDSMFVDKIEYYNTNGELVKDYLEETIGLPPMATVNYVIEKEDQTGGAGANFLVSIFAKSIKMKPIIQAVMVLHSGNKGFAFTTDGYSISEGQ